MAGIAVEDHLVGATRAPVDVLGRFVAEDRVGHPVDEQMAQLAALQPFLSEMGDEAISLLPKIV